MKIEEITQVEWDNELTRLAGEKTGAQLLAIPGIYEILSEHFNNEILDNLTE